LSETRFSDTLYLSMNPFLVFLKKYAVVVVIILLILVAGTAFAEGFRVGPGVTISRVGTLTLNGLPKGATTIIDSESRGAATATSSAKSYDLTPGNHMLIVSAANYFPWSSLVSISSGKTSPIAPIFVPMNIVATSATGTVQTAALAAIASSTLPTQAQPLILENGCADIYVENNRVVVQAASSTSACTTPPSFLCANGSCDPTVVFAPNTKLNTVLPYPGHSDALIVGINNILYAIALDPRSPQFFAPILEGASVPVAAELGDGTVVVRVGKSVFTISL
jgi:hypothetical protein